MTAVDESELSVAFMKRLQGTLTCLLCGPLHRFLSGTTHKRRTKHPMREMLAEERAEEIKWYREIEADGEAARVKVFGSTAGRIPGGRQNREQWRGGQVRCEE